MKTPWTLFLVVTIVLVRAIVLWRADFWPPPYFDKLPLYVEGLISDTWEFLFYFHKKPIGPVLRDIFLLKVVPHEYLVTAVFVLAFSIVGLSSVFFFYTLRLLGCGIIVGFVSAHVWSILMLPMDFYSHGRFAECITTFWLSWYLFSLAIITRSQYLSIRHLCFHGAALVGLAFWHPQAIICLAISLFLLVMQFGKRLWDLKIGFCMAAILSFFLLPFLKNFMAHGQFSTSSVAGTTAIQRVIVTLETDPVEKYASSGKIPTWYRDCYQKETRGLLNRVYGTCYRKMGGETSALLMLEGLDETPGLRQKIVQDLEDEKNRPWFFEQSRFAMAYNRVSFVIWVHYVKAEGLKAWTSAVKIISKHYFNIESIVFPEYGKVGLYPLSSIKAVIQLMKLSSWLLLISGCLMPLVLVGMKIFRRRINPNIYFYALISTLFSAVCITTNLIACCENDRYYFAFALLPFFQIPWLVSLGFDHCKKCHYQWYFKSSSQTLRSL